MNTPLHVSQYSVPLRREGLTSSHLPAAELQVRLEEDSFGSRPAVNFKLYDLDTMLPSIQGPNSLIFDASPAAVQTAALKLAAELERIAAQLRAEIPNLIGRE